MTIWSSMNILLCHICAPAAIVFSVTLVAMPQLPSDTWNWLSWVKYQWYLWLAPKGCCTRWPCTPASALLSSWLLFSDVDGQSSRAPSSFQNLCTAFEAEPRHHCLLHTVCGPCPPLWHQGSHCSSSSGSCALPHTVLVMLLRFQLRALPWSTCLGWRVWCGSTSRFRWQHQKQHYVPYYLSIVFFYLSNMLLGS